MQQAEWFTDDVPADSPLFADLNPTQREAVAATEGPVVVVAGAGSGKTRVLTYRIAHLISDLRVAPDAILAITFTNKAANEMRERVGALVGGMVRSMWVSTFHSACVRILRREAPRLGYKSAFTIYDDADCASFTSDGDQGSRSRHQALSREGHEGRLSLKPKVN